MTAAILLSACLLLSAVGWRVNSLPVCLAALAGYLVAVAWVISSDLYRKDAENVVSEDVCSYRQRCDCCALRAKGR